MQKVVETQCKYLTRYPDAESRSVPFPVTIPMRSPCVWNVEPLSYGSADCRAQETSNSELFHNSVLKLLIRRELLPRERSFKKPWTGRHHRIIALIRYDLRVYTERNAKNKEQRAQDCGQISV